MQIVCRLWCLAKLCHFVSKASNRFWPQIFLASFPKMETGRFWTHHTFVFARVRSATHLWFVDKVRLVFSIWVNMQIYLSNCQEPCCLGFTTTVPGAYWLILAIRPTFHFLYFFPQLYRIFILEERYLVLESLPIGFLTKTRKDNIS